MKRDNGFNIAMIIQECNLQKSVLKVSVLSSQSLGSISIFFIVCTHNTQAKSICSFGVNGGVSWLFDIIGASFFTCKNEVENITHFLFLRPSCHENFEKIWSYLETEILNHGTTGETHISNYINKATVTRCDLSPRFFCIDAALLCEFESDKI